MGAAGERDQAVPSAGRHHRKTVAGRAARVDKPALRSPRFDCTMLGTGKPLFTSLPFALRFGYSLQ